MRSTFYSPSFSLVHEHISEADLSIVRTASSQGQGRNTYGSRQQEDDGLYEHNAL